MITTTAGIIGRYIGMTSIFDKFGKNIPCSIIQAGPCFVTQIKTIEKDGYSSIQLGFNDKKYKKTSKPLQGHFKKSNVSPKTKLTEFNIINSRNINLGDKITIEYFKEGDFIKITGMTKGKGFQGVVKRHKFSGVGQRTHGQHNRLRSPGSIGAGSDPSRVFKGTRMAGRMGNKQITIKNIKIIKVDLHKNLLLVQGSIPGNRNKNSYLIIKR